MYQMANIPDTPAWARQNLLLISFPLGENQTWEIWIFIWGWHRRMFTAQGSATSPRNDSRHLGTHIHQIKLNANKLVWSRAFMGWNTPILLPSHERKCQINQEGRGHKTTWVRRRRKTHCQLLLLVMYDQSPQMQLLLLLGGHLQWLKGSIPTHPVPEQGTEGEKPTWLLEMAFSKLLPLK